MMNQQHVLPQISDYVLGLLPGNERRQVERHMAICPTCRQALHKESQVGQLVRSTLNTAIEQQPAPLAHLMPTIPSRHASFFATFTWHKQLATIGLFLTLLLGGLSLRFPKQQLDQYTPSPTFLAVTATVTNEPTATLVEEEAGAVGAFVPVHFVLPAHTAVPAAALSLDVAVTPAPVATPMVTTQLIMSSN